MFSHLSVDSLSYICVQGNLFPMVDFDKLDGPAWNAAIKLGKDTLSCVIMASSLESAKSQIPGYVEWEEEQELAAKQQEKESEGFGEIEEED